MALDTPQGAAAKLGRYELLKEQAKSGLGATWLARSTDDPADAPLRTLLRVQKSLVKKPELAQGLLADAQRAESLHHPNALRMIEAGTEEGEIYLVTEYAEGELLSGLVTAAGPAGLPLPIVLRVVLDALAAVSAAHAQEALCHGELAPQSLLVGVDGVTRVAGFGTARGLARLPLLGAKNGDRLAYAAPERVKSMASPIAAQVALEPRADVFALGVILWEGVTKQRLFSSKIEAAVIQKVLTATIAAPGSVAGVTLSPARDAAILKALDRDPLRRFQTAAELLAAVEAGSEAPASHAEGAEHVEKLAGKTIAARRNQLGAPAAKAARTPTIPPPRPPQETRPSVPEEERTTVPVVKPVDVKIEAAKALEAEPAETKAETPKPAAAKAETPKPTASKPLPTRKQTLLGVVPSPAAAVKIAEAKPTTTPLPAVAKPAPPPPPPARPEFVSAVELDDGFDVDVGSGSEDPPAPAKAEATKTPAPARVDVKPIDLKPEAKIDIRSEAKVEITAPMSSKVGPLSERKTGATPTTITPTSDSMTRGKSATAIDKIGPASTLGRYEILTPIARGGMASVWAARLMGTRGFQKLVAVKTMLPDVSDDPDFEQMFLDEARVAARIRHPNVAEILDLGEQDDVLYLVMEWVDGENLSVVLKAARALGGMPLPIILRIASQACAGLHAAHELRDDNGTLVDLIHRDVSPANVLVSTAGFVKLVDFGVAKSKGRMHVTRAGGMVKGKTPYLSPEQLGGLPLDRRSDIFSFGALLYVMATGLHPFRGETEGKTVENIALKNPVPLRTINAALPVEFEKLVLKALEKDPKNRFSSAAELQRALDQIGLSLGDPANESDVAEFVRKAIGETQAKRAADIKSAIASLDGINSSSGDIPRSEAARLYEAGKRARADGEAESLRTPPLIAAPAFNDETPIGRAAEEVDTLDAPPPIEAPLPDAFAAAEASGSDSQIPAPRLAPALAAPTVNALPLHTTVGEDSAAPSSFDEPSSALAAPPRSKRVQIIVGAVVGVCALVGVLAVALGGGKAATGPAQPEATQATAAPSAATPTAIVTAAPEPPTTAAVAVPPVPTAEADVAPPATAEPVTAPTTKAKVPPATLGKPPTTKPPTAKPPTTKPPTTKPPTTKKYNPTGI